MITGYQPLYQISVLHNWGIFSQWNSCLVLPLSGPGKVGVAVNWGSEALVSYVTNDPCSREDPRNNNNLVQLLLLLDFKCQILTFALYLCECSLKTVGLMELLCQDMQLPYVLYQPVLKRNPSIVCSRHFAGRPTVHVDNMEEEEEEEEEEKKKKKKKKKRRRRRTFIQ